MSVLNTFDSSGSMASQMRCVAMLLNVANDKSRAERRVAAEIAGSAEGITNIQVWALQVRRLCHFRDARVASATHYNQRLSNRAPAGDCSSHCR
jgi:hypothetical protein